jgi:hypothetical protein
MTLPTLAEAPRPIREAAETLEERQADLRAAQQAAREAEAGVAAARREDLLASASARDQDRADPGQVAETAAKQALSAAQRSVEVEEIRQGRAEQALQQVLLQGGEAWAAAVQKAHAVADGRAAKLVAELRQLEARRGELRGLEAWLDGLVRSGHPPARLRPVGGITALADPRNQGELMRAEELLAVLEAYVHASSVEERRAERIERERAEEETEQRRAELRQRRQELMGS